MSTTTTRPWDAADHLESIADIAAYLDAALEDGDPGLIAAAIGDIARSKGMTQVAMETGLGRESLYKALSPVGNPSLSTLLRVVQALGLRLRAVPAKAGSAGTRRRSRPAIDAPVSPGRRAVRRKLAAPGSPRVADKPRR